jgi:copper(I)-binding protein
MPSRLKGLFSACAVVTLLAITAILPARAGNIRVGAMEIDNAWTHATSWDAFRNAVFLTMVNHGDHDDSLLKAAAPSVAKITRLTTITFDSGSMELPNVADIAVPAHHTVGIAPGGYHVILEGLKEPLKKGQHFPLILTFRHAGTITVTVDVAGLPLVH